MPDKRDQMLRKVDLFSRKVLQRRDTVGENIVVPCGPYFQSLPHKLEKKKSNPPHTSSGTGKYLNLSMNR